MNQELKEKLEKVPAKTYEDFLEQIRNQEDNRTPIKKFIDDIQYIYYESGRRIEHIFARKYKLEKEHRQFGFTYWDRPRKKYTLWNPDITLAWLTLPILVRFRKADKMGCPGWLDDKEIEDVDAGSIRWDEILDEMIYAFNLCIKDEIYDIETSNRVQQGLELYGKYFRNLWD